MLSVTRHFSGKKKRGGRAGRGERREGRGERGEERGERGEERGERGEGRGMTGTRNLSKSLFYNIHSPSSIGR